MAQKLFGTSTYRDVWSRLFLAFVVMVLLVSTGATTVIAAANIQPTLDTINIQTIQEDSGEITVQLSGISAGEGDAGQSLTVTASSSDPLILPDPAVTYASPDSTGSLALHPALNAFGDVDVTVTVQDDGGTAEGGLDHISQVFHVTITPVNDPPTVSSSNKTGKRANALAFTAHDFSSVYLDIENTPLASIRILRLPDTGILKLGAQNIAANTVIPANQLGLLSFVPDHTWYGSTYFEWIASDGQSYASVPATFRILYPYSPLLTYLPTISIRIPPPAFNKIAPSNGATGQALTLRLEWQDTGVPVDYDYCLDAIINNACDRYCWQTSKGGVG